MKVKVNHYKVVALPSEPSPNSFYFIEDGDFFSLHLTNSEGVPKLLVEDATTLAEILDAYEEDIENSLKKDENLSGLLDIIIAKQNLELENVANLAPEDLPVSTDQEAAIAGALASANSYTDAQVTSLWKDQGSYDASGNTFPVAANTFPVVATIKKGFIWTVSVGGTLGGHVVNAGDTVRALVNAPGKTDANWAIGEQNIGYVPENAANKDVSGGYAGLTLFKLNFWNALGTFKSFFTNSNTAARTYTFQNRDGTIADDTDITGAKARANHTGTQLAATISDFAASALAAVVDAVATLQNKTLNNTNVITVKDANFTIEDDGDATKQFKFQASGITAGQTRTATLPNKSGTLAMLDDISASSDIGMVFSQSSAATSGNTVSANATTYMSQVSNTFNTTESARQMIVPVAGTLKRLYIKTSSAQPGGGALTLTLRKNGADTVVVVTIAASGAAGTYSNTADTVAVAAGDLVSIKAVNADGVNVSAAIHQWAFVVQ
jgi:hypothetical protein